MSTTCRDLNICFTNREDIRRNLVNIFLDEHPGTGKGNACSKYIYTVENLVCGNKIVLKRPARLNRGFDFEVHVDNIKFPSGKGKTNRPSHKIIFEDLEKKEQEDKEKFRQLLVLIDCLYNCDIIQDHQYEQLSFKTGLRSEVVCKIIKWLFIEQDITYWNWSGRNMFYSGICERFSSSYR